MTTQRSTLIMSRQEQEEESVTVAASKDKYADIKRKKYNQSEKRAYGDETQRLNANEEEEANDPNVNDLTQRYNKNNESIKLNAMNNNNNNTTTNKIGYFFKSNSIYTTIIRFKAFKYILFKRFHV